MKPIEILEVNPFLCVRLRSYEESFKREIRQYVFIPDLSLETSTQASANRQIIAVQESPIHRKPGARRNPFAKEGIVHQKY
jgi:hypothetical protein